MRKLLYAISLFFLSSTVAYATAITEGGEKQPMNIQAIIMFLIFVGLTLHHLLGF